MRVSSSKSPIETPPPNDSCWIHDDGGLQWLADGNPDTWHRNDGTPNYAAIARSAGVAKSSITRFVNGGQAGGHLVRRLSKLGATARGVTPAEAQNRIFREVDRASVSAGTT